jgi:hypothetical protein
MLGDTGEGGNKWLGRGVPWVLTERSRDATTGMGGRERSI